MNNKYLIALDLDGTHLKDDKTISLATKKYLKELEDEGHLIVLTSGRALRSVLEYYKDISLSTSPVIAYNGHYSTDPNLKHYEIVHKISKNTAKSLYSLLNQKYIDSAMSENQETIYVDKDDAFLFAFYEKDDLEIIEGPLDKTIKDDVFTFVMKIDFDENKRKKIREIVSRFPDVQVRFWSGDEYCELYLNHISKSKTIQDVATLYNISLDNIIVFGDADNDIEMLRDYKHSYVMKNGNIHLREIAKNVTRFTNEEDGIIYELKEFFKENI